MPKVKRPVDKGDLKPLSPPLTTEGRMMQLASLAADLAEQRLRDGTASAQEVTVLLKYASEKEQLEKELLATQTKLAEAKIRSIESSQRIESLYADALTAMRTYQGTKDEPAD